MFRDIEIAFNTAVIAGDRQLAERYAAIWLWLLRAEAEEDRETIHLLRSPANADGIAEADVGLLVEHEPWATLAPVKFLESPELPEPSCVLPGEWPWLSPRP